jgi:hypothetical protein
MESSMGDKENILEKIEQDIKGAAKAVEDFADKVAAPQEPVVLVPAPDAPPPKPPAGKD